MHNSPFHSRLDGLGIALVAVLWFPFGANQMFSTDWGQRLQVRTVVLDLARGHLSLTGVH
jgi:hypothetical protein